MDISAHTKAGAEEQAFAFGDLELVEVVRDAVGQPRVIDRDLAPVPGEVEPEQGSALEKVPAQRPRSGPLDAVPGATADEANSAGATSNFQLNSGSL
jgi:hypothetical protein